VSRLTTSLWIAAWLWAAAALAAAPARAQDAGAWVQPAAGERASYWLRLELVLDVVPPRPELPPMGAEGLEPRGGAERGLPDFVVEGQRVRRTLEARLELVADARGRLLGRLSEARLEQSLGASELYPVGVEHLGRVGLVLDLAAGAPRGSAGLELASATDASTWGPVADLVEALRTALALAWPAAPPDGERAPGGSWQLEGSYLAALQGVEGLRVGVRAEHRLEAGPGPREGALLRQRLQVAHEGMLGGTQELIQLVADGDGEAEQRLQPGGPWPTRTALRLRLHLRQRRPHGPDAAAVLHECVQELRLTLEAAQLPGRRATSK